MVTITVPGQVISVNVGCTLTVVSPSTNQSVQVPVTIQATVGGPTPTPSPTGTGIQPLVANPPSVVLLPGVLQPASANILISPASEGPFTASISCLITLGSPPVATVNGNVVTVTVAGQIISVNVGCTLVVSSPSTGQSVNVPVLIQATVLGGPSPTPTPTGTPLVPLTANPSSVVLLPGVLQPATAT